MKNYPSTGARTASLAAAVALLTACSGGGGSGPVSMMEPSMAGNPEPETSPTQNVPAQAARAAQAAQAAQADPTAGSVTQSSDVDIAGGTSRDSVSVTIDGDSAAPAVRVTYNGQQVASTETSVPAERVEFIFDQPKGTRLHERFTYEGSTAVEFYRSLAIGDLREADGTAVPAGDLWVDVYTNYEGTADYLAGGIWVYFPEGGYADDYEFGAFADGGSPISHDVRSLTGSARYLGGGVGVYTYSTGVGRTNEFFDAYAELNANFDTNMVSGRIDRFHINDEQVSGNPALILADAPIGDPTDAGFFKGTTSLTHESETYTGKWGGQFFNGVAGEAPGSVAGTFGAANNAGESFVGSFGAHKQ